MTSARSALLLSGSIGLGHDVASRACADVLRQHGWSTETLDAMRMLGRGSGAAGETVFRTMLAAPGLFDAVHFGALRTGNRLALATSSLARRRLAPPLRDHLERHPVQLLISAFATGAAAASAVVAEHPAMVHVVLCTDATPHRIWVQPNVDMYLVTSEVAELAVLRFQPDALVRVVPQPVRSAFYQPRSQAQARSRFDIPVGDRCVLLMSGGWGLGPVAAAAEALAAAGLHVLAVAGRNERLAQKLLALAAVQPRVRAFGFTDQVPDLMAAADLVITPAGAATCAEARVVGRTLLLLDVVQGHGRDNLQHELELGDAMVTSSAAADVARCAVAALDRSKPAQPGPASSPLAWAAALTTAVTSIGL